MKMQRENLAFTQLVKVFEDAVYETKSTVNERLERAAIEIRAQEKRLTALITNDVQDTLRKQVAEITHALTNVESSLAETRTETKKHADSILSDLSSKLESLSTSQKSNEEVILSVKLSAHESETCINDRLSAVEGTLSDSLDSMHQLRQANDASIAGITATTADLKTQLVELASKTSALEIVVTEQSTTLTNQMLALQTMLDQVASNQEKMMLEIQAVKESFANHRELVTEELALLKRPTPPPPQLAQFELQISRLNQRLTQALSAGISKYLTLPRPVDAPWVDSELFSLSRGYSQCHFRLFPDSQVWLVWRPVPGENPPPVFLDLSLDGLKRGPVDMRRRDELHGCWVWAASFPESTSEEVTVGAEIPARQWLEGLGFSAVEEEEAETVFSFAPAKNPFESEISSLTPRRATWTQFGSNPFG